MTFKRITQRQIAEGKVAETAAAIGGEQRVGVLDGVRVDFRHPELSLDWEAQPFWYVAGPTPQTAGMVFPTINDPEFSENRQLKEQYVELHPGDCISVESVVPKIGDGRFDHPHDSQLRLAYLKVTRPSGETLSNVGPLAFFGRTKIRGGAIRESFDHVLSRIAALNGGELYERGVNGTYVGTDWDWSTPLEELARHVGASAHDNYFRLREALPNDSQGLQRAHLRAVANYAALAGFLLGKAEAQNPERIASAIHTGREKAVAKITNVAWLERASEIWSEHPEYRRNRVAEIICEENPDEHKRSVIRALKKIDPHLSE